MFDSTKFDQVFPSGYSLPYDRPFLQEADSFRKSLDGALFFDRVLKTVGITKSKIYPPKTENALRTLHQQICDAEISLHHRLSLLYYLLLDFDAKHEKARVAVSFAEKSGVPMNYQIFMQGLWYMDREQFSDALEYISHPSLSADFADDIIIALVRRSPHNDYSLALSYFHTVQPVIKSAEALSLLFDAMVFTDVMEAFYFSRRYPDNTREQLLGQLIKNTLEAQSFEESDNDDSSLMSLTLLPLDPVEEQWFEDFLTGSSSRGLKKAKETLLMRKIATGKYAEASSIKASGGNWEAVLEGVKIGVASSVP